MALPKIHQLINYADTDGVALVLRADTTAIHARDEHQWTPLHRLAAQGDGMQPAHCRIATLLLDAGADVNARDMAGQTPLHLIAMHGSAASVPVAELILTRGADIRATNALGWDWHHYWQHGQEVLNLLLAYDR